MKYIIIIINLLILFSVSYADNNKVSADNNKVNSSSSIDLKNPLNYYPDFIGKIIKTNSKIISLDLPNRIEDAAFVPLKIIIGATQKELFIKKIWVFIDNNPVPLAALFNFGKASEHASLAFKIRINANSFVRVIALTDNNEFYQAKNFVKTAGGCSAPIDDDLSKARKHIGEMRLGVEKNNTRANSILARLKIRHINLTGLQMNQLTRIRELPHYITNIKVSSGDEIVFIAQTSFSISQNPNFHFYVLDNSNQLKIEILDTIGLEFTNDFTI